jgi:hypothetical protein
VELFDQPAGELVVHPQQLPPAPVPEPGGPLGGADDVGEQHGGQHAARLGVVPDTVRISWMPSRATSGVSQLLSYSASFRSLPAQLVYCEHGNQFDPSSTIADYANPLDTPVDAHVVAELVRPIGSGARIGRGLDLREVSYVFPLAAHPGPAEWIAGPSRSWCEPTGGQR